MIPPKHPAVPYYKGKARMTFRWDNGTEYTEYVYLGAREAGVYGKDTRLYAEYCDDPSSILFFIGMKHGMPKEIEFEKPEDPA